MTEYWDETAMDEEYYKNIDNLIDIEEEKVLFRREINEFIYKSGFINLLYDQYNSLIEHILKDLDININYNMYFIDNNKISKYKNNDEKKIEFILSREFDYKNKIIECTYDGSIYFILKDDNCDERMNLYDSIAIELDLAALNRSNVRNLIKHILKKLLIYYEKSLEIDFDEFIKNKPNYFAYIDESYMSTEAYIYDNIQKCMEDYIEYYKNTESYRKSYRDIIKYECQSYIEDIIYKCRSIRIRLEDIDILSRTPYEGIFSEGTIILTNNKKLVDIEFKDKLSFTEHKGVRKLLELSNNEYALITDGNEILGLSKIRKKDINKNKIKIKNRTQYLLHLKKLNRIEKSTNYLGIKFNGEGKYTVTYNGKDILGFEYGYPINKKNKFNEIYIKDKIKSSSIDISIQSDICRLVKSIVDNGRGGMIVISPSPKTELERLEGQSILIDPVKVDEVILRSISRIDGSIIIDKNLVCHAIGVILDGSADINIGDRTRGARYNAALKYIYNDKTREAIAIVVSEDGMIDVIDKNNTEN